MKGGSREVSSDEDAVERVFAELEVDARGVEGTRQVKGTSSCV